ncbi:YscG family type III secretion system chaperone [Pseudomonas sp. NPDC089530]|uniref:YscG family type III secretion system chaperone n=1 Tax=Pseudomonas sp. NPDC089530 TaxID=3390651 RepID=UPI003CFD0F2A
MMDSSLKGLMAELALAGSGHHCHEEAQQIASWLEQVEGQEEAACLIRLSSLMNQGHYQQALALGEGQPWPALAPWLALCEWRLGLGTALDRRLAELAASDDPRLVQFALGMRDPEGP